MSETAISHIKITKLTIEDFMGVAAVEIDAKGNHVRIEGPNGSGKSSVLDAIFYALAGHRKSELPDPVKHGAKDADIWLELDNGMKVHRHFAKSGNSRLDVYAGENKVASPQALLNELWDEYCLDPEAFLRRSQEGQIEELMHAAMLDVRNLAAQVVTLTKDDDDSARDGEMIQHYFDRLCADRTGKYYMKRLIAGQEAARAKEAKSIAVKELEDLGGPLAEGERQKSIVEMSAELRELEMRKSQREEMARERTRLENDAEQLMASMVKMKNAIADLELQVQAADKKEQETRRAAGALTAKLEQGLDLQPAIDKATEHMETIEDQNESIARRKSASDFLDRATAQLKDAEGKHMVCEKTLDVLRAQRQQALDGIDVGVPGLKIDDGQLFYKGVPLKQASTSEQYRVAIGIAAKRNPNLRLLRVDNGEHLDAASMEALFDMAEANDFQVIVTAVKESDELMVSIVEGESDG